LFPVQARAFRGLTGVSNKRVTHEPMNYLHKIINLMMLIAIVVVLISYPNTRDFNAPFTASGDADANYISQALRFNAGVPQTYFDHTGYLLILALSLWIKISRFIGLVPVDDILSLVESQEPFGQSFAPLVYSARIFSLIFALIFVSCFVGGVYILTKRKRLSLLAGLSLASTQGVAIQTILVRPELLSALFFMLAILSLLFFCRQNSLTLRLVSAFLGALFSYAAIMTKIQIIPGILMLPLIVFIWEKRDDEFPQLQISWRKLIIFSAFVFIFISKFILIVFHYLFQGIKILNLLIVVYFVLLLIAFHIYSVKSWKSTYLIILAAILGVAVAFYFNYFHFDIRNTDKIVFFYEWSQQYMSGGQAVNPYASLVANLKQTVLDKVFFGEGFLENSFDLIYLIAIGSSIYLAFQGNIRSFFQAGSLIVLALMLETIFKLRYSSSAYSIYTDFLILMSIIIAWLRLQSKSIWLRRGDNISGFVVLIIAGIFFFQSNQKISDNKFLSIKINQPHQQFCDRGVYYPIIAELIHHNDKPLCVQTILEGCSSHGTISSCRP